jgi:UDP-N-acetylmuramate dehydrogenase
VKIEAEPSSGDNIPSPESLSAAAQELEASVAGRVRLNQSIAPFTSFRVGGPAAIVVEPKDPADLLQVSKVVTKYGLVPLVLGRGTNLLVSDRGFPGVVVRLGKTFDWIRESGNFVEAGGATPLPQVANKAARLNLTGLEFTVAIPATVGGAVRMNAGAHGSQVSDVLESATVCRLEQATLEVVSASQLKMSYRESALGPNDVVCEAKFRLQPGARTEIAARMNDYRAHRSETQPVEAPNAGSMFTNPPGTSAGRLIETAGLKGYTVGQSEVSHKHANFFLAHAGTTAQQIYDLMAHVQKKVEEQSGVSLIPEVRIVGAFDRSAGLKERP